MLEEINNLLRKIFKFEDNEIIPDIKYPNMIHYIGSKPYFKKLNISETFWNLFSDKSFYILKNRYSNKINTNKTLADFN